jgi:arylsulfatase A-like enzyme
MKHDMPNVLIILGLALATAPPARSDEPAATPPNVVFILIDDLGYGDLGCTGNKDVPTPNIDRLAADGTLFTRFYVASPICSPSRVAFTTGQYPARHRFHSFLAAHADNQRHGMPDWLDPAAPSIARSFHQSGYGTAHIGKWHMGGGRDVGEAPLPQSYGFDESLTSFEGLGDRILPPGPSPSRAPRSAAARSAACPKPT